MPEQERKWLRHLRKNLAGSGASPTSPVHLGIGDDAALIQPGTGYELAVTTDLFLEDVHFLRERDQPASCGHRIATRAFSDLAAMGAEPLCLFLSCGFPADLPDAWTRAMYRGVREACGEAGASIAGGDLAASPSKILVDVVGVGRVQRRRALLRSGAQPGDRLFVSGRPGLAARGRHLVHAGLRPRTAEDRLAVARHRQPRARWELGLALSRQRLASAAIDISDGLSTDLDHLCEESGTGAILQRRQLPLVHGPDALRLALEGGEDYELLFTVPPECVERVRKLDEAGVMLTEIGAITRRRGLWLREADGRRTRLVARGWEHFAAK